jgi:hypothetical protein
MQGSIAVAVSYEEPEVFFFLALPPFIQFFNILCYFGTFIKWQRRIGSSS